MVDHPLPGVARALVIAGSDKRGTIFGIYDLSAAIGVSPWYWRADVPVAHKNALYLPSDRWVHGPPAVKPGGSVKEQQRLHVSVDWQQAAQARNSGTITIRQNGGPAVTIQVEALHPSEPSPQSLDGFVEADHLVSIDAAHFTSQTTSGDAHWVEIPRFGETLSGMTIFPVAAPSMPPPQPATSLEYRVYLFDSGTATLQAILAPTNNFVPRPRVAVRRLPGRSAPAGRRRARRQFPARLGRSRQQRRSQSEHESSR